MTAYMVGAEAGGVNSACTPPASTAGPWRAARQPYLLLQSDDGQITDAHSISAGLDYPGIGPEHAWLHEQGRVEYVSATDDEALEAFLICCRQEGIIPALETAHALAEWLSARQHFPRAPDGGQPQRTRRQGYEQRGRAFRRPLRHDTFMSATQENTEPYLSTRRLLCRAQRANRPALISYLTA